MCAEAGPGGWSSSGERGCSCGRRTGSPLMPRLAPGPHVLCVPLLPLRGLCNQDRTPRAVCTTPPPPGASAIRAPAPCLGTSFLHSHQGHTAPAFPQRLPVCSHTDIFSDKVVTESPFNPRCSGRLHGPSPHTSFHRSMFATGSQHVGAWHRQWVHSPGVQRQASGRGPAAGLTGTWAGPPCRPPGAP